MVDPPNGAKIIDCKWIYKLKVDGIFKESLVAKVFKQTHGIDYDEILLPVVILKFLRILLTIATYYDYEIW